jgi:hypothetical protein
MGFGSYEYGPPYGVPITSDVHEQYTDELKNAWEKFDAWWKSVSAEALDAGLIDRKSMPDDVRDAWKLILETPIPGYEEQGFAGKDSCYMITVLFYLTDPEE